MSAPVAKQQRTSGRSSKLSSPLAPSPSPLPQSAISNLPVELLSYIFVLSAETPTKGDDNDIPFDSSSVKLPLIIARVSKHWRSVARNTPRLWTRICITPELVGDSADSESTSSYLDLTHALTCLTLSRSCPLDILIDARDQEWDFTEPEIPSDEQDTSYSPPFTPAHIAKSLSLLLPHLHRWQSLNILTDTWAPMFVALNFINPYLITHGAPRLESLTLMRCNDFVSFNPEFQPKRLMRPDFLSRNKRFVKSEEAAKALESTAQGCSPSLFPRLKHLNLRGVHVDWSALAAAVQDSSVGGLRTLHLGSHSLQVRPSAVELRKLLQASPKLEVLSVRGSGCSPLDGVRGGATQRVTLEKLKKLEVGYRSVDEAKAVFRLMSAPSVMEMVLEDVTYPSHPEVIDGSELLVYVGCGRFHQDRVCDKVGVDGDDGRPFPILEDLTLRNVKTHSTGTTPPDSGSDRAGSSALRALLEGTDRLKKLEVDGNGVGVSNLLFAMTPNLDSMDPAFLAVAVAPAPIRLRCPSPRLESLTVRMGPSVLSEVSPVPDLRSWTAMAKRLVEARQWGGGAGFGSQSGLGVGLREVKLQVESFPEDGMDERRDETVLVGGTKIVMVTEILDEYGYPEDDEGEESGGSDGDNSQSGAGGGGGGGGAVMMNWYNERETGRYKLGEALRHLMVPRLMLAADRG
ncbi:hypothetical protein AX17_006004 [Amanita inopinata Kibby_2008]|nr:hypothetical protein AX17_006004 [Amanita inopinata Kibby_2008]